ncbi:hypothetical protein AgCh_015906 [Apium graveolens]
MTTRDMKTLKKIDASYTTIEKLSDSITHLMELVELNLKFCEKLRELPEQLGSKKLRKLTEEIGNTKGLEIFIAGESAIQQLPDSFGSLINLVRLHFYECKKLRNLPNSIWKLKLLKELNQSKCSNLEQLPEQLGKMQCLETLYAPYTAIEQEPDSIGLLCGLRALDFKDCKKLKFVPISIWNLTSIEDLSLHIGETGIVSLPDLVEMKKLKSLPLSCNSISVNIHTVKDPNTIMSDTETPIKPTKTEEPPKTQIQSWYETIRVPILRPSEYPIWKVRMTMFLEATDPEYLDGIKEGPHKPTKLAVAVAGEAAKTVPKEKSDYTAEDIASIAKDAKVRHLLHSAIDNVMSNRVINCKTAKDIWDALETRCQGTDTIKKNRKTILTQEYGHFDSKANESLNDLYDRFVKLLNDLSLVDKEYDIEDSNLKFLLALPLGFEGNDNKRQLQS